MIYIHTQAHGVLAFKMIQTRLGVSLKYGKNKNNLTKGRDQAL